MTRHNKDRVILHVDLDAFYCQVEHVRLGIPIDTPLCVQQWQGLIAVNYAARAAGIKRHCTVEEAKTKCPNVVFVHVATYREGDTEPAYHSNPKYATHKVSLDVYRRASARIFKIFVRFCSQVQKASIDEAYLDVTTQVNERIARNLEGESEGCQDPPCVRWPATGIMVGEQVDTSYGWSDLALSYGADISTEIRHAVFTELGYTCSTGIAHNKTLAKLCSALNKPNKQTVIRSSQVLGFMEKLPFQKIRNLGGKLGREVEEELGAESCGELWKYSLESLKTRFNEATGIWLYNIVRGVCHDEVVARSQSKSMAACKSLRPPVQNEKQIKHWMGILASELFTRLMDEFDLYQRWPKTMTCHFSYAGNPRSRSCPMPKRKQVVSPDVLADKAWELFQADNMYPCTYMGMGGSGFIQEESNNDDITRFFKPATGAPVEAPVSSTSPLVDRVAEDNIKTESPRKGSLLNYLSTPSAQVPVDEESFTCDQCQKQIPLADAFEHSDWHFAQDLVRSERQQASQIASSSERPRPAPSPKSLPRSKKVKKSASPQVKLTNFFKS